MLVSFSSEGGRDSESVKGIKLYNILLPVLLNTKLNFCLSVIKISLGSRLYNAANVDFVFKLMMFFSGAGRSPRVKQINLRWKTSD